jgi:hypothetical protein
MAYESTPLESKRMKDLLGCSLGKCMATAILAIDGVNSENIQSTGTPVMYLPNGRLSVAVAAAELDLSDSAVCIKGAGQTIPAGEEFCLFVIQDGTSVLVMLGDSEKIVNRATVEGALTSTVKHNIVPKSLSNEDYVVTGFVHVANVTNDFVVGTTGLDAAGVTDTYYNTGNLLSGSRAI